jgi:hypothetical protein
MPPKKEAIPANDRGPEKTFHLPLRYHQIDLIKLWILLVPLHPVLPFGRRKDPRTKEALVSDELTAPLLQTLHRLASNMRIKVPPSLPADATTIIPLLKAISASRYKSCIPFISLYRYDCRQHCRIQYPKDVL